MVYRHHPDRLVKTDDITMMWIQPSLLLTRLVPIFILPASEIRRQTRLLIDTSCPADGNIKRKQAEKLEKYSDLWGL